MHHALYAQLLVTLAFSVLLVALFRRFKFPTVLAYLLVGFLLGQMGFAFFAPDSNTYVVAEIGVVFMLFTLGLEFSVPKVVAMRKQVLGLGSLQVGICMLLFSLVCLWLDIPVFVALIVAAALAMSSTAIVTKQLNEQGELNSRHGLLSIATLLFQDMAAVPFLILVPILAVADMDVIASLLSVALLKGVVALAVILVTGKWLLPRLFHEVAAARSDELFVMTSLGVAMVASWFTSWLGLSMAFGAFLTGMLLAESQFKHQIETEIRPFRDILLGLFFITIGTLIDIDTLLNHWLYVVLILIGLMAFKLLIIYTIARGMAEKPEDAFKSGLILSQAGELGFVLIGIARQQDMLSEGLASIILSVGVLSMFASPFIIRYADNITQWVFGIRNDAKEQSHAKHLISEAVKDIDQHVIICGFGRNGQTIKRFLDRIQVPSVILDLDPMRVREAGTAGESIFYGDATRRSILRAAGIEQARLVIVTFDKKRAAIDLLHTTHLYFPKVPIIVRTKDDRDMETLLQSGASQVIPDSLESSLMLVSHVMFNLGVPMKSIIKEIQKVRDDRYHSMQSFFHGETSDLMRVLQTHHEQLHAVVLTDGAFAIGKAINQISMPEKICIEAVKRGKESYTPPDRNFILSGGDIVLLSGEPDYIENAENILFSG